MAKIKRHRITFSELYEEMARFNAGHPEMQDRPARSGVIVFSAHNWTHPYSEEARSYRVYNNCPAFIAGKISNRLTGNAIDGSDMDVRLDWYKWAVEYCYMED